MKGPGVPAVGLRRGGVGWTIVEMFVVALLFGIILTYVLPAVLQQGRHLGKAEVTETMRRTATQALLRIHKNARHIQRPLIEYDTIDWQARLQLSKPMAWQNTMAVWSDSSDPMGHIAGSYSFSASQVGNYFIFYKRAGVETESSGGVTARVSRGVFVSYYLTEGQRLALGNKELHLCEWESVPYADYFELTHPPTGLTTAQVAAVLYARGIRFAFDVGKKYPADCFYTISPVGALAAVPAHTIPEGRSELLTSSLGPLSGQGWRFGVAPPNPNPTIPHYTQKWGSFTQNGWAAPGFEVHLAGVSARRLLSTRLVLGAQGTFKGGHSVEATQATFFSESW